MEAANRRYLEFISAVEDCTAGIQNLEKISKPADDGERTYRGFRFFDEEGRSRGESLTFMTLITAFCVSPCLENLAPRSPGSSSVSTCMA